MSTFYIGSDLKLFSYLTFQSKTLTTEVALGTVFYNETSGTVNSNASGNLYLCVPSTNQSGKEIRTLVNGIDPGDGIRVEQNSLDPGRYTISAIGGASGDGTVKGYYCLINNGTSDEGKYWVNFGSDLSSTVFTVKAYNSVTGDEIHVTPSVYINNNFLLIDFGQKYTNTIKLFIFIETSPSQLQGTANDPN